MCRGKGAAVVFFCSWEVSRLGEGVKRFLDPRERRLGVKEIGFGFFYLKIALSPLLCVSYGPIFIGKILPMGLKIDPSTFFFL